LEARKPEDVTENKWKQKGEVCVGVLIGYGANPDESIEQVKNYFCPCPCPFLNNNKQELN